MCASCGCGSSAHDADPEHVHPHEHADDGHPSGHSHGHAHSHAHEQARGARTVPLEAEILAKNDTLAAENRARFVSRGLTVFNLTSSPGAGKTTLLEAVIRRLEGRLPLAVVEGDQETENDAQRIRATGVPAVQINTRTGCHLDARMVRGAVADLAPRPGTLLLVENVGNLVCPALFDLGERAKVVLMSVTEGEDKPLKYPHMFRAAEVLVLSKIDLLPHVEFDVDACLANARRINPSLLIFRVSARSGAGVAAFCDWLVRETGARV